MLQVNKELEASESRDGHGDGFWSNALAVYARDQGPLPPLLRYNKCTGGKMRIFMVVMATSLRARQSYS